MKPKSTFDTIQEHAHIYLNKQELTELIRAAKAGKCYPYIIEYLQAAGDEMFWRK